MYYSFKLDNAEVLSVLFDTKIDKDLLEKMIDDHNAEVLSVLNGIDTLMYQAAFIASSSLGVDSYSSFMKIDGNVFTYHLKSTSIRLNTTTGTFSINPVDAKSVTVIDLDPVDAQKPLVDGVVYYKLQPRDYRDAMIDAVISSGARDYLAAVLVKEITKFKTMQSWIIYSQWFMKDHSKTIFPSWKYLLDEYNKFRAANPTLCPAATIGLNFTSKSDLIGAVPGSLSDYLLVLDTLSPAGTKKTLSTNIDVIQYPRIMNQIVAVYEFNNTRIYLSLSGYGTYKSYYSSVPTTYYQNVTINIMESGNSLYRYVDVDRKYLNNDQDFHGASDMPLGQVVFTDLKINLPSIKELEDIYAKLPKVKNSPPKFYDQRVLDSEVLKLTKSAEIEKEVKLETETLQKKINFKISGLSAGTETFKVNGVEFNPDFINYEGQILKIAGKLWVGDFLANLPKGTPTDFLDSINFDKVRQEFIVYVINSLSKASQLDLKVGDINITIDKKVTDSVKDGKTVKSTRYYLNNERINTEEIGECIDRALCYTIQKEYNSFLDSVSKCSLRIHGYLQRGLEIELANPFRQKPINLILPLTREDGKNYIKIADIKYKVKDTNKLISVESLENSEEVIAKLTDPTVIYGLPKENIIPVVKAAIEVYKTKIVKANQFLEQTEKRFGLSKQQVTLDNGSSLMGYIVQGTLRDYFVESAGNYDVYSYPQGKHICMVDKSIIQTGVDKLIGRLYALKNDAVVAQHINTLEE